MRIGVLIGVMSLPLACGVARAAVPTARPPTFVPTDFNPVFTINPPTVTGFSFSGQAFDENAGDTVRFFVPSLPPRFVLTSTPGNPGSYTVTASGLSNGSIGTYSVGIVAFDDSPDVLASSVICRVRIVPEPSSFAVILVGVAGLSLRRR